jgi:carnitine O-acetyltransferase
VVKEFRETGEGERLLERLRQYAESRSSYIEEFWCVFPLRSAAIGSALTDGHSRDESYLNYADPVVLSLNPFFILELVGLWFFSLALLLIQSIV